MRKVFTKHFIVTLRREVVTSPALLVRVNREIKQAVQRNRVKRVLREFFQRHRLQLPPFIFVFRAVPETGRHPNRDLFTDLEHYVDKISKMGNS